jgi:acetyltransferase-like isoleucine patch superfamily enzyme
MSNILIIEKKQSLYEKIRYGGVNFSGIEKPTKPHYHNVWAINYLENNFVKGTLMVKLSKKSYKSKDYNFKELKKHFKIINQTSLLKKQSKDLNDYDYLFYLIREGHKIASKLDKLIIFIDVAKGLNLTEDEIIRCFNNALRCFDDSYAGKEAQILNYAKVCGSSQILDNAVVSDSAVICDSCIEDNAQIFGNAIVKSKYYYDYFIATEEYVYFNETEREKNSIVKENAKIGGNVTVLGGLVTNKAKATENQIILNTLETDIDNQNNITSHLTAQFDELIINNIIYLKKANLRETEEGLYQINIYTKIPLPLAIKIEIENITKIENGFIFCKSFEIIK